MRMLLPLVVTILITAVASASQARAQQPAPDVNEINAQADGQQPPRRPNVERPRPLIACTRTGCRPIPPGCWIEMERNWDGLPTGFDAIICPFR